MAMNMYPAPASFDQVQKDAQQEFDQAQKEAEAQMQAAAQAANSGFPGFPGNSGFPSNDNIPASDNNNHTFNVMFIMFGIFVLVMIYFYFRTLGVFMKCLRKKKDFGDKVIEILLYLFLGPFYIMFNTCKK